MNRKFISRTVFLLMFFITLMLPVGSDCLADEEPFGIIDNTARNPQLIIGKDTKMPEVAPGDTIDLVIPVQNISNTRASKVLATLAVSDVEKIPFDLNQMSTTVSVPAIDPTAWENIRFNDMQVSPQAKAQIYPLQINLEYTAKNGSTGQTTGTVYIKVIDGKEAPQLKYMGLQLENDKSEVDAGESEMITLKIHNPSEFEVRDVKLQLSGFGNEAVMLDQALDTWETKTVGPKEFCFAAFKLRINSELDTGTYPLTLNMSYKDTGGREYEVKDTKVYIPVEGGVAGKDKRATPRLIIDNFDYGGQYVQAGQTFGLGLNLRNTSQTKDLVNIKLSFTSDENVFAPVGSSNTLFVERVPAGQSLEQSLRLRSKVDAESKTYNINVELEYEDAKGNKFMEKGMVGIDVIQKMRLTLSSIEMPETAMVEEPFSITLDYFNTGRATIRNLAFTLEGEGFTVKSRESYVGSLEAGKSDYYDVTITPTDPGLLQGNIKVTYEDVLGNQYTENRSFSTEVEEMEMFMEEPMPGMEMPPEPENTGGWMKWAAIGAGAAALFAGYKVYRRRKQKREDAELDE